MGEATMSDRPVYPDVGGAHASNCVPFKVKHAKMLEHCDTIERYPENERLTVKGWQDERLVVFCHADSPDAYESTRKEAGHMLGLPPPCGHNQPDHS